MQSSHNTMIVERRIRNHYTAEKITMPNLITKKNTKNKTSAWALRLLLVGINKAVGAIH